tara:strand:- start:209 stop:388 length:180 start_codon:yes stop_codon:yes gene_type:complete
MRKLASFCDLGGNEKQRYIKYNFARVNTWITLLIMALIAGYLVEQFIKAPIPNFNLKRL